MTPQHQQDLRTKQLRRRAKAVDLLVFIYGVLLLVAASQLALRQPGIALGMIATGVALLFAIRLKSIQLKSRISLLLVSATLSAFLLEAGLRLFAPVRISTEAISNNMRIRARLASKAGQEFDTRSLLEVILDNRKEGRTVFPGGSFEFYLRESDQFAEVYSGLIQSTEKQSAIKIDNEEVLPLGHPSNVTVVGSENENGSFVQFHTDEYGFRNPQGIWSADNIDIVAVGDSFTEGCGVRDEESFVSLVREEFPHTINLGLGGGGPLTMLASIREYGERLKPNIVLWCFFEGNDLLSLMERSRCSILANYVNDDEYQQDLAHRREQVDAATCRFIENEIQDAIDKRKSKRELGHIATSFATLGQTRTRLRLLLDSHTLTTNLRFHKPIGPEWAMCGVPIPNDLLNKSLRSFQKILIMAKQEVKSWGGELYFVYLPSWNRVADPSFADSILNRKSQPNDIREKVLGLVANLELNSVDTTVGFAQHADPISLFPFRVSGHYTPEGYRIVAEQILHALK